MTALLLCRQWFATRGYSCTVVVAATKEDAAILARARFDDAKVGGSTKPKVREATDEDVARFEEAMRQAREAAQLREAT